MSELTNYSNCTFLIIQAGSVAISGSMSAGNNYEPNISDIFSTTKRF